MSASDAFSSWGQAGELAVQGASMKANAGILDVNALQVIQTGEEQAKELEVKGSKIVARQRAMYAKAGVNFTGSPALVWAESEKNVRMDVLTTRLNYAAKANEIGFEALQMRIAAGRARTAAVAKAGQGLLQLVGSFNYGGGTAAVAGQGGYGANTPAGTRNMGTYSTI